MSERRERELAAEHRGEDERAVALVRKVREPARDHVAKAPRRGAPNVAVDGAGRPRREQAHDLAHEQRVAFGLLVQSPRQAAQRRSPVPSGRRIRQTRPRSSPASETRRVTGSRASAASSSANAGPGAGRRRGRRQPRGCGRSQLARQEPQEQQRRDVGRVQIVEHQHDRPTLAAPCAGTRVVASNRRKRAPSESSGGGSRRPGKRRAARARAGRAPPRRRRACARSALADRSNVAAQRLRPGPVGGRATRLPAAPHQHPRAACSRARGQLVGKSALADARLATEQDEASVPRQRVVERRDEHGELASRVPRTTPVAPSACARSNGAARSSARILPQDRLLQLPQLAARLDPELVDERCAARRGTPPARRPGGRSDTAPASAAGEALAQRMLGVSARAHR